MDESNFVVKTIFHARGSSEVLTENYFVTRKEAEEFCALTDYAMKLNYGAEQQLVTTEIVELSQDWSKARPVDSSCKNLYIQDTQRSAKTAGAHHLVLYIKEDPLWFHLPSALPGVPLPIGSRHTPWSPTSAP